MSKIYRQSVMRGEQPSQNKGAFMTDIKINSCDKTPNYDALEAVGAWMMKNIQSRNYKESRTIKVKSGRTIKVTEIEKDKGSSLCSCNFVVEIAEA